MEYPLPHDFSYSFNLAAEDETRNSTIATLIQSRNLMDFPSDVVEVNPKHASFAEETGPACQVGSIVPRINVSMQAYIPIDVSTTGGGVDDLRTVNFNWMPIYTAFPEGLESINQEDGATLETILELQHSVAGAQNVTPLFSTVNLLIDHFSALHPVNTVNNADAFGDWDLATDLVLESVAFDSDAFFDTLRYGTNKNMLKKMIGKWNTISVDRRRPYHFSSNNFTNPIVKRMNPQTFCGILFHMPQANTSRQVFDIGDTTATSSQLHIDLNVSFPEWNSQFDQTAIS